MSDALLTRIAVALELLASSPAAAKAAPAAAAPKPTPAGAGKAAATAGKPAPAAPKPAAAAPPKPPADTVKAPGGKYNAKQVRDLLREVAGNEALGRQAARDIIKEDGGGAESFVEVKPEFYDGLYEACRVALSGEGADSSSSETDDFGL